MTTIDLSTILSSALANAALLIAAPSLGCLNTYTRVLTDLCRAYSLPQPDLGLVLQYRCTETLPSNTPLVRRTSSLDSSNGNNIAFQNLNTDHCKILNNLDLPEIKKGYMNIKFEDKPCLNLLNQTGAQLSTCTSNEKPSSCTSQDHIEDVTPSDNTINCSKQLKQMGPTHIIHDSNIKLPSRQEDLALTSNNAKPVMNIHQEKCITLPIISHSHPTMQDTSWSCTTCQYNNESKCTRCDRCGRNKEPIEEKHYLDVDGPECPQCTFINERGERECEMCGLSLAPMETFGRVCQHCTMRNENDELECNMCDQRLVGPILKIEVRVCENCTLINENLERVCNMCGMLLVAPNL